MNVRVLGKGLELLSANGGWFEINQLLFADDTALVAHSEGKLCRLVSEFGRVCERRKLRVKGIVPNKIFCFIIHFYAIMHRRTIVQNALFVPTNIN